jgi:hypothetical protein
MIIDLGTAVHRSPPLTDITEGTTVVKPDQRLIKRFAQAFGACDRRHGNPTLR